MSEPPRAFTSCHTCAWVYSWFVLPASSAPPSADSNQARGLRRAVRGRCARAREGAGDRGRQRLKPRRDQARGSGSRATGEACNPVRVCRTHFHALKYSRRAAHGCRRSAAATHSDGPLSGSMPVGRLPVPGSAEERFRIATVDLVDDRPWQVQPPERRIEVARVH